MVVTTILLATIIMNMGRIVFNLNKGYNSFTGDTDKRNKIRNKVGH
jgi:hypothetical protein